MEKKMENAIPRVSFDLKIIYKNDFVELYII